MHCVSLFPPHRWPKCGKCGRGNTDNRSSDAGGSGAVIVIVVFLHRGKKKSATVICTLVWNVIS